MTIQSFPGLVQKAYAQRDYSLARRELSNPGQWRDGCGILEKPRQHCQESHVTTQNSRSNLSDILLQKGCRKPSRPSAPKPMFGPPRSLAGGSRTRTRDQADSRNDIHPQFWGSLPIWHTKAGLLHSHWHSVRPVRHSPKTNNPLPDSHLQT